MILGFKRQFKQPIIDGIKIHTIRPDKLCRWRKGTPIHFATGVRTKDYDCFNDELFTGKAIRFLYKNEDEMPICTGVQEIVLRRKNLLGGVYECDIIIDGKKLPMELWNEFAINDGFKRDGCTEGYHMMFNWFEREYFKGKNHWEFRGRLIHWTDKRY